MFGGLMMKQGVWRPRLRRLGLIVIGVLTLTMIALTFVQAWVVSTAENPQAYGAVAADQRGWPDSDQRGAFLMLNEPHSAAYPGNLVELLATTEPGVVDEKSGAHVLPAELKAVLVQSAIVGESRDYRVYRIGEPELDAMDVARQPGGKVMIITPSGGGWQPGAYLVDVPSEGMFGGRTYFQFYVDGK
jgi:hypothetical protein